MCFVLFFIYLHFSSHPHFFLIWDCNCEAWSSPTSGMHNITLTLSDSYTIIESLFSLRSTVCVSCVSMSMRVYLWFFGVYEWNYIHQCLSACISSNTFSVAAVHGNSCDNNWQHLQCFCPCWDELCSRQLFKVIIACLYFTHHGQRCIFSRFLSHHLYRSSPSPPDALVASSPNIFLSSSWNFQPHVCYLSTDTVRSQKDNALGLRGSWEYKCEYIHILFEY